MSRVVHREEFGDSLIKDYLEVFNTFSFKNELYGQISLHVLLGQALCKHIYYRMGSRQIDPRIHMLLIKPQGTGKGAGYGFVQSIADKLGLDFQSLTESTDAGLVGTIETKGKESTVVDGLLKSADIVGMEEASVLFDYTSEFSKKNMTYMQICMNSIYDNSCYITKKLGSEIIEFKPHASFLLMTYPPDKLVDKLMKTGFIDRVVPIFEDVSLAERLEVIAKMSRNINISTKESFAEKINSVATRLDKIVKKYEKSEISIHIEDKANAALLTVIEGFSISILDAAVKAREKLEHFISRLYEVIMKLAIHHAIICQRTTVTVGDIAYARLLYLPIWRNLIISIESLLIIDPLDRHRRHRILRTSLEEYDNQIRIGKFVKDKVWVRRPTMLSNLKVIWDGCSGATADNNLLKLEKELKVHKEEVFKGIDYGKNKFFDKKYFGSTAYLKKIKDIK